ncbi:MAG TPA: hypothetical protein VJ600_04100, partial [Holophagaceae bacterium]|nr:hypothetical protein [Holophagaceae bacterium]
LFVCEHGNVKSLMAATYFNQLAQARGLPFRAIARGVAPDSQTVPSAIAEGLRKDGFEVSGFHPEMARTGDIQAADRVVLISTDLPLLKQVPEATVESWWDVPPATTDFAASSRELKRHVEALIDHLSPTSNASPAAGRTAIH